MNDYSSEFKKALLDVTSNGSIVSPRGMRTLEISPYHMGPIDCDKSVMFSKKRKLNYYFLFAELFWYLSGKNDSISLSYYNSNISSFSEQGIHDGAYGIELREQIRYIVDCLSKDADSRQAVMIFFRKNPRQSKDVPCTINLHFMIRDGKLNCYATMRSNDLIWGNNYDVPSFCGINQFIARCLNVPVGILFLTSNSMHLYYHQYDIGDE